MPKRKHGQKISYNGEWKPVDMGRSFTDTEGTFEGLIEIEELIDYHIGDDDTGGSAQSSVDECIETSKDDEILTKRGKRRKLKKALKTLEPPMVPPAEAERIDGSQISSLIPGSSVIDLSKWEPLYVTEVILKALRELNFATPTPIQELCLPPAICSRKDIIGAAETGSGKTLAFAIPIIQNIMEDKANEREKQEEGYLRALVLTPTRELAVQIKNHIEELTRYADVTTCLIVGGMFKEKQDRLLKRRPDILIATPGRLFEHIQNRTPYLDDLSCVRYLVVDEADRMVEKGHFRELNDIMQRLNDNPRSVAKRQNFVFSATLCSNLKKFGKAEDSATKEVSKGEKVTYLSSLMHLKNNAKLIDLSNPEGTAEGLVERRMPCTVKEKDYHLYYLLMTEASGRTIVFCNSLDCVRRLYGVFSYLLSDGSFVNMLQLYRAQYSSEEALIALITGLKGDFSSAQERLEFLSLSKMNTFRDGREAESNGGTAENSEETGRIPLVIHAGMHQKQRLKNFEKFHASAKGVLLASDVASRGLDIPDVQFVIHYQVPRNPDLYVHRSGRTARAFKVGSSVLVIDPSDAAAYNKILRSLHREKDFPLVNVETKFMRFAKERVDLARRIDAVEHVLRKEASQDEWFLKAAEESEVLLDDEDVKQLDIQAGSKRTAKSKEAKLLKKQLKVMLTQPLYHNMRGFSQKYPTLNFARKHLGLD